MNQLITHQRVVKRKRKKKQPPRLETFGTPANEPGEGPLQNFAFSRILRKVSKKPHVPGGPRILYVIGGMLVIFITLVLFSAQLNRGIQGMGGGLGAFPRDAGIDSLLDMYLNPGKAPDGGAGDIVPTGDVLMSYEPVTYVVERGDTVSGIAYKFDLDMSTIISFNGIDDVRRLQAGVELKIPPVDGVMHLVKRRESLSSIAASYGVDLEPILDINNIDSEIIHEGDKLFVPNAKLDYVSYHRAMGDLFVYPLRGPLSSGFGVRKDPFTGLMTMHRGYDIVARVGTPVKASNTGRVVYTGQNSLYGNYVLLSHQGGYQTLYGHLSRWSVAEGQWVSQNQKIGEVGTTGRSTGPHLHFSIYYNGDALDPGKYLYY